MDHRLTVRCACGWVTTGSEESVVAATSEHGQRLHNMSATREQILVMATTVDVDEQPSPSDGTEATQPLK